MRLSASMIIILVACASGAEVAKTTSVSEAVSDSLEHEVGDVIDSFEGVDVYYNGVFSSSVGRNMSADGYNIGLKYQCVEFVKRYYLVAHNHKMPNTWGHAKDFFISDLADGEMNSERGMFQHANGGETRPSVGDIIVFSPTTLNRYGHVAIVSSVQEDRIEVVQQNTPFSGPRETIEIEGNTVKNTRVLGWLSL